MMKILLRVNLALLLLLFAGIDAGAAVPWWAKADSVNHVAPTADSVVAPRPVAKLADWELRTAVFDRYDMVDTLSLTYPPVPSESLFKSDAFNWLDDGVLNERILRQAKQRFAIAHPELMRYNERLLPEPPRKYRVEVDPQSALLTSIPDDGIVNKPDMKLDLTPGELKRRHWVHNLDARLQFAQAYVSPNWYQGGSNNLTVLFNFLWEVKLNRNFHPNLLAEASVSYKLNIHGTPEDSLRNYNISEDLLQFNGKFGFKAWRKWFYTVTTTFKTQFFNSHEVNKRDLKAAFLSPGELNVGLGMTYNKENKRKTFRIDASISPLSWNMKTCINRRIDPATFGIEHGRRVEHEFGSNLEVKMDCRLTYNIRFQSRLFAFTDYSYLQGDWENTFTFDINRYLSTQLYVHLRYDSSTPRVEDSKWHVWQLNEILSFGVSYRFATI